MQVRFESLAQRILHELHACSAEFHGRTCISTNRNILECRTQREATATSTCSVVTRHINSIADASSSILKSLTVRSSCRYKLQT